MDTQNNSSEILTSKSGHSLHKVFWSLGGLCSIGFLILGFLFFFSNNKGANSNSPTSGNFQLLKEYHEPIFASERTFSDLKSTYYKSLFFLEAKNESGIKDTQSQWEKLTKEFEKNVTELEKFSSNKNFELHPNWTQINDEWKKNLEQLKKDQKEFQDAANTLMPLVFQMKHDDAKSKYASVESTFAKVDSYLTKAKEQFGKFGNGFSTETKIADSGWLFYSMVLCWVGLVTFLTWRFSNLIKRKFSSNSNEILALSSSMVQISKDLASSSDLLMSTTTEQTAALQESAATMDEITAMVKRTEENASTLESLAKQNQESADKGKHSVLEMVTSIGEIQGSVNDIIKQVDNSNVQIAEIVDVIKNIGAKTKVINDIVFQTKLLSFNASVEAARAGEHGRGFAVVAQEVGSLAQMSGTASKEISDMLNQSVSKVEEIVRENKQRIESLMADGKSKVDHGTEVAKIVEASLEQIIEKSETVNSMIKEINAGVLEQNKGVREIVKTISVMNISTENIAVNSTKGAKGAKRLHAEAMEISESMTQFRREFLGVDFNQHDNPKHETRTQPVQATKTSENTKKNSIESKKTGTYSKGSTSPNIKPASATAASSLSASNLSKNQTKDPANFAKTTSVTKTASNSKATTTAKTTTNVVPFKPKKDAVQTTLGNKVVHPPKMQTKATNTTSTPAQKEQAQLKNYDNLAATGTEVIPSSDDPRFEDI